MNYFAALLLGSELFMSHLKLEIVCDMQKDRHRNLEFRQQIGKDDLKIAKLFTLKLPRFVVE